MLVSQNTFFDAQCGLLHLLQIFQVYFILPLHHLKALFQNPKKLLLF